MSRAARRTTFTYARADVHRAVLQLAALRGCDPQDVINDILAAVLIDRRIEQLEADNEAWREAVKALAHGGTPTPTPTPLSLSVPVPAFSGGDTIRRNPWEQ